MKKKYFFFYKYIIITAKKDCKAGAYSFRLMFMAVVSEKAEEGHE